jgi:glycosyltransferase involved in cell wall biosynthesis
VTTTAIVVAALGTSELISNDGAANIVSVPLRFHALATLRPDTSCPSPRGFIQILRGPYPPAVMRQPVSVAMAVYNGLPYLREQMASVLRELRLEDELVVVDDRSTDGSLAWLQGLDDPRLVLLPNDQNLGVRRSFERALGACTGEVVLLCDQDDVWLTGKRDALALPFAQDPNCTAAISDAQVIDGLGAILSPSFMAGRGGFRGGWWSTLFKNRYLGCCMAIRRDVIALGLPIPPRAPMHDMWFGMLAVSCGRVHYVPQPYVQYRRHDRNVSPSSHASIAQMLRWRRNLFVEVRCRLGERSRNDTRPQQGQERDAGSR